MRSVRVLAAGVALGTSFAAGAPAALAATAGTQSRAQASAPAGEEAALRGSTARSIDFVGMPAPATPDQKASAYSAAKAKVTYPDGSTKTVDLTYHQLMATGEKVNGKVVGGLFDVNDKPISDANGQIASDAPDGNSLIKLNGMKAAQPADSRGLALVTQYEYRGLPPAGPSFTEEDYWSRLPATMSLARIDQNKKTGALKVTDYNMISFASVMGLWISCAASLSPWNTHLSSEEYEPDAKTREGLPAAEDTDDTTDIASFSKYFFGDPKKANPYDYGITPEVTVSRDGKTTVTKHYAMGRIAREVADVQADGRTAYMGDDGAFTGLFMFVADKSRDLSAGTLYAGKWTQTSPAGGPGGTAKLSWIRLGHGTDSEIKAIARSGIKFSDIFAVSNTDPRDKSYTKVQTYMGTEWLKLKPGKEKAAAFLETRRYAALLGATTEFNKMEGVTHDAGAKKAYVVMSRLEKGMSDKTGHIQVAGNIGGAIYEMKLGSARDSAGKKINSSYVAGTMASIPELLGNPLPKPDAAGNKCDQDHVCGGDNLKFSPGMRTLFVGEDTGNRNNNYVWAFNVDTKKLSRILSVPMGAEATGLQAVDDYNGSSYVMSNFQHPGEAGKYGDPDWPTISTLIDSKWNKRLKTAVGYLGTKEGALPAIR